MALTALQVFLGTSGPARKAGGPALAAALAFAAVLALGSIDRLAGWDDGDAVLWTYDGRLIATIAIVLLHRPAARPLGRSGRHRPCGGSRRSGRGRDAPRHASRALGDPSLVVGYRLPETGAFVDDAGRPVELPSPGSGKTATAIEDTASSWPCSYTTRRCWPTGAWWSPSPPPPGSQSPTPVSAETQTRAAELETSRRRIVEAADAQRRRVEQELRLGAERRLENDSPRCPPPLARRRGRATGEEIEALEGELDGGTP